MATLKELESSFLQADAANDTALAAVLANEIRRLRAQGEDAAQPERAGSTVGGSIHNFVSNIGQGTVDLFNSLSELPALAEDKTAAALGISPEELDAIRQARAAVGVGTPRRGSDVHAKIQQDVTGPYYQSQGTVEDYSGAFGRAIPSLFAGPGKAAETAAGQVLTIPQKLAPWATSIKNSVVPAAGAAAASETGGQLSKDTPYEPYVRFFSGLGGGLFGAGLNNWWGKPSAPLPDISPGAQARVGNALNDSFGGSVGRALARGDELGPEAMTLNLGNRPLSQAVTIAKQPGVGSSTINNAVTTQIDGSGRRALADWESAIGSSVSRFENELAAQAKKAGTSSLYKVAEGRPIDPAPLKPVFVEQIKKAGNDPEARKIISRIEDMLIDPAPVRIVTDPRSGMRTRLSGPQKSYISEAGNLVNVRQKIDEEITKLGKEISNNPGDDLFAIGSRTATGSKLVAIRKAINDTLHQDDTLKAADTIWSSAEKVENAFKFGNERLLGTGNNVIEPEALIAQMGDPTLTLEEATAIVQGLSRRGKTILGDVRNNRNDGKAMGDAIATGNNLSRISAVSGPEAATTVGNMANREDLFANHGSRIQGNSVTAEAQAGQAEFPSPLLGGPQYGQIAQTTLLGSSLATATKIVDTLTRGLVSSNRSKLAADAAKLLTKTGAERDAAVRSLMDYSAKLPKGHPLKTIIAQAVSPTLTAVAPALLGR